MNEANKPIVVASWARAEAKLDVLSAMFHQTLQKADKTAGKLFAGTE
jgi:hypothetical protein